MGFLSAPVYCCDAKQPCRGEQEVLSECSWPSCVYPRHAVASAQVYPVGLWNVPGEDKGLVSGRCWSFHGLGCPVTGLKGARQHLQAP